MDKTFGINGEYKGIFGGSRSWNGLPIDELKSGIQKYIRRGNFDKAVECLIELDLFSEVEGGEVIRSNMINRLKIILCEDIFNPYMVEKCGEYILEWEKDRNKKTNLINIVKWMCEVQKFRFFSEYKCLCMIDLYGKSHSEIYSGWNDNNFKTSLEGFEYFLDKKDDRVFIWYKECIKSDVPIKTIWAIIKKKWVKNIRIIELMQLLCKKIIKEKEIFIFTCIGFIIKDKIWDAKISFVELENKFVDDLYKKNINGLKIILDDYVVDKHTKRGCIAGKGNKDFFMEGRIVENEIEWLVNTNYRNLYAMSKGVVINKTNEIGENNKTNEIGNKIIENNKTNEISENNKTNEISENNKTNEISENKCKIKILYIKKKLQVINVDDIKNIEMCRKNTASNKVMCFFGEVDGIGRKVFKEVTSKFNSGRDSMVLENCKDVFGIKKIGMKRVILNKVLRRKNTSILEWENNSEWVDKKCVYLMMDVFDNVGTLVYNKELIDDDVVKNYLKIGLFRSIFRVTDFCPSNVLINKSREILSIDEHMIGNKGGVMSKKDVIKKRITDEMVKEVLNDLYKNKEEKLETIKKWLICYDFEHLYDKCVNWYNNLEIDFKE